MENPDLSTHPTGSALFTVRIWRAALGDRPGEMRMQARHLLSGETRSFRHWAHLADYLEGKLEATRPDDLSKGGKSE